MLNTPGDMASTVVCPNCEAETIEHQPLAEYEYRCLRCGTAFNIIDGTPSLAGSDDPDAP